MDADQQKMAARIGIVQTVAYWYKPDRYKVRKHEGGIEIVHDTIADLSMCMSVEDAFEVTRHIDTGCRDGVEHRGIVLRRKLFDLLPEYKWDEVEEFRKKHLRQSTWACYVDTKGGCTVRPLHLQGVVVQALETTHDSPNTTHMGYTKGYGPFVYRPAYGAREDAAPVLEAINRLLGTEFVAEDWPTVADKVAKARAFVARNPDMCKQHYPTLSAAVWHTSGECRASWGVDGLAETQTG